MLFLDSSGNLLITTSSNIFILSLRTDGKYYYVYFAAVSSSRNWIEISSKTVSSWSLHFIPVSILRSVNNFVMRLNVQYDNIQIFVRNSTLVDPGSIFKLIEYALFLTWNKHDKIVNFWTETPTIFNLLHLFPIRGFLFLILEVCTTE